MQLLDQSADPCRSIEIRKKLLLKLFPKYFIKAIDETLEIQCCGNNDKILVAKENIVNKKWNVKQAMEFLS